MRHTCTKFRENQPAGSGEEDLRFLPYMGMAVELSLISPILIY